MRRYGDGSQKKSTKGGMGMEQSGARRAAALSDNRHGVVLDVDGAERWVARKLSCDQIQLTIEYQWARWRIMVTTNCYMET